MDLNNRMTEEDMELQMALEASLADQQAVPDANSRAEEASATPGPNPQWDYESIAVTDPHRSVSDATSTQARRLRGPTHQMAKNQARFRRYNKKGWKKHLPSMNYYGGTYGAMMGAPRDDLIRDEHNDGPVAATNEWLREYCANPHSYQSKHGDTMGPQLQPHDEQHKQNWMADRERWQQKMVTGPRNKPDPLSPFEAATHIQPHEAESVYSQQKADIESRRRNRFFNDDYLGQQRTHLNRPTATTVSTQFDPLTPTSPIADSVFNSSLEDDGLDSDWSTDSDDSSLDMGEVVAAMRRHDTGQAAAPPRFANQPSTSTLIPRPRPQPRNKIRSQSARGYRLPLEREFKREEPEWRRIGMKYLERNFGSNRNRHSVSGQNEHMMVSTQQPNTQFQPPIDDFQRWFRKRQRITFSAKPRYRMIAPQGMQRPTTRSNEYTRRVQKSKRLAKIAHLYPSLIPPVLVDGSSLVNVPADTSQMEQPLPVQVNPQLADQEDRTHL